jgi:hypothetical protein
VARAVVVFVFAAAASAVHPPGHVAHHHLVVAWCMV